jgi:putative endonuclease
MARSFHSAAQRRQSGVARTPPDPQCAPYWLYLLECEDGAYYAGIALDVERRFFQHVFGRGARFTRARPPLRVLAARQYPSRGDALRAELRLKALPRAGKLAFFEAAPGPDAGRRTGPTGAAAARDDNGRDPAAATRPTRRKPQQEPP